MRLKDKVTIAQEETILNIWNATVWWPWLTSKRIARVCQHQLSFLFYWGCSIPIPLNHPTSEFHHSDVVSNTYARCVYLAETHQSVKFPQHRSVSPSRSHLILCRTSAKRDSIIYSIADADVSVSTLGLQRYHRLRLSFFPALCLYNDVCIDHRMLSSSSSSSSAAAAAAVSVRKPSHHADVQYSCFKAFRGFVDNMLQRRGVNYRLKKLNTHKLIRASSTPVVVLRLSPSRPSWAM